MSNVREFKTESKQLLNLMINSIYTHKEIFLRELISNASDALDKYNYLALTDERLSKDVELKIELILNKDQKTITIKDNGIGMTEEDLVENLGTIAKSGSKAFIEKLKENSQNTVDIIGQFGVGFYSAFMVASKVVVNSKSPFSESGYIWESTGESTYNIEKSNKVDHGTEVILYLRDDEEEDEAISQYLDEYEIKSLVKKYSDYVRYPIMMDSSKEVPVEGKEDQYETVVENETINSMVPIWKKSKSEITDEELNEFYKHQYHDFENPIKVIHTNVEGTLNYNALIFIPTKAPYDLYSDKYEKGLQLYSKGVFIQDKCKELVPDYLRFIKGLVDSPDLSLNISREILQHNKQLSKIASNLEKKIKNELERMLANEREKYVEFFKTYGVNLKYGLYDQYGAKKDLLKDLVLFISSHSKEYTTLKEYVSRMKENQEFIYYASGNSIEQIDKLPQMELLKDKEFEVLYFTDDIDEFAIGVLMDYEGKKFKSISQGDLDLQSKEEKKELEDKAKEHKDLLQFIQENLKDKVSEVKLSSRLKDSAVCLVSKEGISFEMERVLAAMPGGNNAMKAQKVLEINPKHNLFIALENLYERDKDSVKDYAGLLYSQALLIEGFTLDDPIAFSNKMCDLMIKSSK
ncbi:MAG: molecular chaperone HtpG [Haloplasmataceae bacterium]|jgi:molecular chaperone HtpG|nr:molecular chaperone HtpG [Haloplasmataceae bacterium]